MAAPDDALLAPARWERGRCVVVQALDELSDAGTRAKVEVAADDRRVDTRNIVLYLAPLIEPGLDVKHVRAHRSRACGC